VYKRQAERLVRIQSSLSESVLELKEALNQLEMLESGVEICGVCQKIFNRYDGEWNSFDDVLNKRVDPHFIVNTCPTCHRE